MKKENIPHEVINLLKKRNNTIEQIIIKILIIISNIPLEIPPENPFAIAYFLCPKP